MKNSTLLKISLCLWFAVAGIVVITGCTTTQQTTAYKTLYAVEQTTVAGYDGYIGEVIAGRVPTNGVPTVSKAFNKFQAAFLFELDLVQFNTNAVASASLTQESIDLLNLITTVSK